MLREAEQRSVGILTEHRREIDQLVALLIENETVDGSVVYKIAGRTEPTGGGGVTMAPDRTPQVAQTAHTASNSDAERE
jgi:cell division protease FtsH